MIKNTFLIAAIALSLAGHLFFLGISGFIDLSGPAAEESLILYLDGDPPASPAKKENSPTEEHPGGETSRPPVREETVALTGGESKYRDYLLAVKQAIEAHWTYPREALETGIAGTVVLEFAITADGTLAGSEVLEPSGKAVLDREALRVIGASAPFQPLPRAFQLDRLKVVARFAYELAPL